MAGVCIVGAYNTKFGAFARKNKETGELEDSAPLEALMSEAVRGAVADAGLPAEELGGVWIGSFAPGLMTGQDHLGPLAMEAFPEALRMKPAQRVEGACASSSLALLNALYAIESGRFKAALVLGVEKMTLLNTAGVTQALAGASRWASEGAKGMTFPGLFAEYAKGYAARHGLSEAELRRMLATAAALMYRNGVENPLAHFGKGGPSDRLGLFSADAILGLPDEKNPIVADPLRLHDCSLVSDGAAALILMEEGAAKALGRPAVKIAGIGHTTERMGIADRSQMSELAAAKVAVAQAYAEAGISAADLGAVEVHDCFTINQLLCVEALGLCKDGEAGRAFMDGRFTADDRCPVNLSGGLKAKGHPVGATGASMHALLYKQMTGAPIGLARAAGVPELTATLNVGGSGATNSVTVLRRVR
jgi:acetyl-CoA C-acetyltransferase